MVVMIWSAWVRFMCEWCSWWRRALIMRVSVPAIRRSVEVGMVRASVM